MKLKKIDLGKGITAIILIFFSLLALFPFVYMLLTSLKQTYSMELDFSLKGINLQNYQTIFKNFEFAKYIANSTIVVVIACSLNAIVSSMAAY